MRNKNKPVTVGDLKDQIGTTGPRPILYCRICCAESSANAGDYFNARKDHVFKCCNAYMALVFRNTVYTPA